MKIHNLNNRIAMKKPTYIAALAAMAALALTACSNEEDLLFDSTAAERLEEYKSEYAALLASDGGTWAMEYFSNEDEPGYVFILQFSADQSVTISGNTKWFGGFRTDRSHWQMIADNGPVLSFDTYNQVLHIFADPANITGSNAPTGDNGDIDETGYGHNGDYEFQFMEVSDDGQTVRLLGKKRNYDIYLRRIPADTDVEAYLADLNSIAASIFDSRFPTLYMVDDNTGETFVINNLQSQIVSIYPLDGDAVMQTSEKTSILTTTGIRFISPIEVQHADTNLEDLIIDEFTFDENNHPYFEGYTIEAPSPMENLLRQDLTWYVDMTSLHGKIADEYDKANQAVKSAISGSSFTSIRFGWQSVSGTMTPQIITVLGGKICRDYIDYGNYTAGDEMEFSITGKNNTAERYDKEIPQILTFKQFLASQKFSLKAYDTIAPDRVRVTIAGDESSYFDMELP